MPFRRSRPMLTTLSVLLLSMESRSRPIVRSRFGSPVRLSWCAWWKISPSRSAMAFCIALKPPASSPSSSDECTSIGLGVHTFAHSPSRGGQKLYGTRDRVREPERAADREHQRQAGDREQDVANAHVRRGGLGQRQLHRDVGIAAVVQERTQQRQVSVELVTGALRVGAVGVETRRWPPRARSAATSTPGSPVRRRDPPRRSRRGRSNSAGAWPTSRRSGSRA